MNEDSFTDHKNAEGVLMMLIRQLQQLASHAEQTPYHQENPPFLKTAFTQAGLGETIFSALLALYRQSAAAPSLIFNVAGGALSQDMPRRRGLERMIAYYRRKACALRYAAFPYTPQPTV